MKSFRLGNILAFSALSAMVSFTPIYARAQAPVIRKALLKATVFKSTFETSGGSYNWRREAVCNSTARINVYDARNEGASSGFDSNITCPAIVDGKKLDVTVTALVGLMRGPIADYPIGGDVKAVFAVLYLPSGEALPDGSVQRTLSNTSFTRDLSSKSFISLLVPTDNTVECEATTSQPADQSQPTVETKKCKTEMPTFFSALVEVVDDES